MGESIARKLLSRYAVELTRRKACRTTVGSAMVFIMSDAPAIRPAATILLLRDDPTFEVLMVKRHHQIDFASGALVFPGGKTHAGDHDPAWADWTVGWDEVAPDERPLRI